MLKGLCIRDCTLPKGGKVYKDEICTKIPAKRWDVKQYPILKHFERIGKKEELSDGDEA